MQVMDKVRGALDDAIHEVQDQIEVAQQELSRLKRMRSESGTTNGPSSRSWNFSATGRKNLANVRELLREAGEITRAELSDRAGVTDVGRYLEALERDGEAEPTGEKRPAPGRQVQRRSAVWRWTGDDSPAAPEPEPEPEADPKPEPAASKQSKRGQGQNGKRRGKYVKNAGELIERYVASHPRFTIGHIAAATDAATSTVRYVVQRLEREGRVRETGQQVPGKDGVTPASEFERVDVPGFERGEPKREREQVINARTGERREGRLR